MYRLVRHYSTQTVRPSPPTVKQAMEAARMPVELLKRSSLLGQTNELFNCMNRMWQHLEPSVKETSEKLFDHIIPKRYDGTPGRKILETLCLEEIDLQYLQSLEGRFRKDRKLRESFWRQVQIIENRVLVRPLPIEKVYKEPKHAPPYQLRSFWSACLVSFVPRMILIHHAVQIGKPRPAEIRLRLVSPIDPPSDDPLAKQISLAASPSPSKANILCQIVRLREKPVRTISKGSIMTGFRNVVDKMPAVCLKTSTDEVGSKKYRLAQIARKYLPSLLRADSPESLDEIDRILLRLFNPSFPITHPKDFADLIQTIKSSPSLLQGLLARIGELEKEYEDRLESPLAQGEQEFLKEAVYGSLYKTNIMLSVIKEEILD